MIEAHQIPPGMRLHPLRATDLTASDLGAVSGIDPHRTALAVYAEKSGLILGASETPLMRRGRWFEAAAVAALEEQQPEWDIRRPHVYLRDPEVRLGATPDCLAEDPDDPGLINVQIKCVSKPVFEREWADGGAPLHYVLQTLAEGFLLNAERSILAALVVDTYSATLELRDVPRHQAGEQYLRQVAAGFWRNMADGLRPAPDYSRDAETIDRMFPHAEAGQPALDLAPDNRMPDLLMMRDDVRAAIDADKARLEAIDAEIKLKLGTAETAVLPGWKISWREQTRKSYTVPAATFRVLRTTHLDEKENAA